MFCSWLNPQGLWAMPGTQWVLHKNLLNSYIPGGLNSKESACDAEDLSSISGLGISLEEGMATYSSILAWRIPRTEEPRKLWSMESQRVRHN